MTGDSEGNPSAANIFAKLSLPRFGQAPKTGPAVVAIEGPNGAGKTTLSWGLSRQLGAPRCLGTDEAWFAEAFKVRMIRDADWYASALFFLSGCFEQNRLLRRRTERLVIMDRCLWSTLAVHAAEDPHRLETLLAVLAPVAGQIAIPRLTLVLEASFNTCQSRIAQKTGTARALDELTANDAFHERECQFYHWLGTQNSGVRFLDANRGTAQEVAERALALIRSELG